MPDMKLLPDRATVYFNPEEPPSVLLRYATVGRLLQAATEMEFLIHCWIEALLRIRNLSLPSRRQIKDKSFPALRQSFLDQISMAEIDTPIKTESFKK
jgi:hypothetical protein